MNINFEFDASTSAAPSGFFTALKAVAAFFDTTFLDNVTINIAVGWGELNGTSLSSNVLGQGTPIGGLTDPSIYGLTYAEVRAALVNDAKSATDWSVIANLAANPSFGRNWTVGRGLDKALGLINGNASAIDGYVGFSSTANTFNFNTINRAQPGLYDFVGYAENLVSQVMGRDLLYGLAPISGGISGEYVSVSDLLRYSSPGQLAYDFDPNDALQNTYFSVDGGATILNYFNSANLQGDYTDWAASAGNDALDAVTNIGVENDFTQSDIMLMDAIGWDTVKAVSRNSSTIFWSNQATQQVGEWTMYNNQLAWNLLSTNANGWAVVGNGDYTGDGNRDILWYNLQTQQLGDWTSAGAANPGWNLLTNNTNGWSVVGSGDYNGDGTSDILWYNAQSQQFGDWIMSGNNPTWNLLSANISGWTVVGNGDYNGDGTSDILFYNASSHQLGDWVMSGNHPTWNLLTNNTNGWNVVGGGDYNGDGTSDILWYNAQSQQLGDWIMHGNSPTWNLLTNNTNGWTVAGNGDYNDDGTSDILWYNAQTQQVGDWLMNNNVPTWNMLSTNTNGWTVTGGTS
jgi:hypothetical protein